MSLTLRQHDVLAYLKANPHSTTAEVASALRLQHQQAARVVLEGLYARNLIWRMAGGGGRGNPYRWCVRTEALS